MNFYYYIVQQNTEISIHHNEQGCVNESLIPATDPDLPQQLDVFLPHPGIHILHLLELVIICFGDFCKENQTSETQCLHA